MCEDAYENGKQVVVDTVLDTCPGGPTSPYSSLSAEGKVGRGQRQGDRHGNGSPMLHGARGRTDSRREHDVGSALRGNKEDPARETMLRTWSRAVMREEEGEGSWPCTVTKARPGPVGWQLIGRKLFHRPLAPSALYRSILEDGGVNVTGQLFAVCVGVSMDATTRRAQPAGAMRDPTTCVFHLVAMRLG